MYRSDLAHTSPALADKLQQLYNLNRDKTTDLCFRPPFLDLLKSFGDPHLRLPPVIHVAGTNGKGSTIAYLKAIFEAAGYSVHSYTSPHLIKMNERIVLAGNMMTDDALEHLIDEALRLNQNRSITFFEITTAMAFAAFARTPADILLLEVGLGGRLDCTNVIPAPLLSVITQIGFDHMEYLGETLAQIAAEKAGIIKPGRPCIIGPQTDPAHARIVADVFAAIAKDKDSKLLSAGAEWFIKAQDDGLCIDFAGRDYQFEKPSLIGAHQIQNAATAAAAAIALRHRFNLPDAAISQGLQTATWPARLQNITAHFPAQQKRGTEIYLDGGHNENAANALAQQAALWRQKDAKPLHLILGMMRHKNPAAFLAPLQSQISTLTLIDIPGEPDAHESSILARQLQTSCENIPIMTAAGLAQALENPALKAPGSRILIAGSLYLAAHVLKNIHNKAHNTSQK
jgi:dihydrofolate synthase/folylpolyglutamate synthase